MRLLHRRKFLQQSCASASLMGCLQFTVANTAAALGPAVSSGRQKLKRTYRAAAIGSTHHGEFGHGLDRALVELPGVEFVAIADDDPQGLVAAGKRNGIERLYGNYRDMLEQEELDLVTVGMRHPDVHEEVIVNCAQAGKHIYCEKPLSPDLASADRILEACQSNGVKLGLALPNRASLAVREALNMVDQGRIGKLTSLRGRGKEDRRGGGEDLMVLGYHMLDLMCLFAGQPQWTFAQVAVGSRDVTAADAHAASEPIGPIAGDCVVAMYGFPNQVHGYFESHRDFEGGGERFGLEFHGSGGIIALRSLRDVVWFEGPALNPAKPHRWQPISTPEWDSVADDDKQHWCHQQLVLDLLAAAEEDREPLASGSDGRWVQEMIQSVYTSHLSQSRTPLPLERREHPLK
jgi:predicted dehydrogenase